MNTVGLTPTDWNVVNRVSAQDLQGLNEQRGGGLSVHVEITPHANLFLLAEGIADQVGGVFHTREGRGRCFERVEENPRRGKIINSTTDEGLGHEQGEPKGFNSAGTCTIGGSIRRVIEIEPQSGSKRAVK